MQVLCFAKIFFCFSPSRRRVDLRFSLSFHSLLRRQRVANVRNFNVFVVFVIAADLEHQGAFVGGDGTLRNLLHNLLHVHRHALKKLRLRLEERVEHANALRDHRDVELVSVLEVLEELGERHRTLHLKTIPQCPSGLVVFLFLGARWLREGDEGKGEVNEAVLVAFELGEAGRKV